MIDILNYLLALSAVFFGYRIYVSRRNGRAFKAVSYTHLRTLKKEHKAGNPDYLTGLRIKNATPRQITDKRQIFKFILKQQP